MLNLASLSTQSLCILYVQGIKTLQTLDVFDRASVDVSYELDQICDILQERGCPLVLIGILTHQIDRQTEALRNGHVQVMEMWTVHMKKTQEKIQKACMKVVSADMYEYSN